MTLISITCPHCGFSKDINAQRLPAGASNIKCPKCQTSFAQEQDFSFEPVADPPALAAQPLADGADGARPAGALKFCPTCGVNIHRQAEICPACGVRLLPKPNAVSKLALLLITFFLGGFGAHRFYQKKYWLGALYLLFFWTYIPSLVAFGEFFFYIFKSEAELQRRYPVASSNAVVFAVIIPFVGMALLGILAAIAIPQFVAYREKAYSAAVKTDLLACKAQAESLFSARMSYPTQTGDLQCQTSEGVALFYLPLGFDEFKIIGYHLKGKRAFQANSASTELAENSRHEIERQLVLRFGALPAGEAFHFME